MLLIRRKHVRALFHTVSWGALAVVVAIILISLLALLSLPRGDVSSSDAVPFIVSVDPVNKTILEIPDEIPGEAAAADAIEGSYDLLTSLGVWISSSPLYRQIAGPAQRYVKIHPGYRKEEVAAAFGTQLNWSEKEEEKFLDSTESLPPLIPEGYFKAGVYIVEPDASNGDIRAMIAKKFDNEILSRYSTSTKRIVSLDTALTIASIIEREAGSISEMRTISGIIWNRLFEDMNLQMDATLQYAKGTEENWWPPVRPKDKYIESPYNTYQNEGLPPAPISNPSIAAVEAALNPRKTSCMFYFHDRSGGFHCTKTYEEHKKLLERYYGRGK